MAAERSTCLTLEAFELAAIAERLSGRHDAYWRDKTLFSELIDLCLRQDFGHGIAPSGGTYIKNGPITPGGGPVGAFWRFHLFTLLAGSRTATRRRPSGA